MLKSIVHVYIIEVTLYKYLQCLFCAGGHCGFFFFFLFWLLMGLHWGLQAFPIVGHGLVVLQYVGSQLHDQKSNPHPLHWKVNSNHCTNQEVPVSSPSTPFFFSPFLQFRLPASHTLVFLENNLKIKSCFPQSSILSVTFITSSQL